MLFSFAFCYIISLCYNHVETNLKAASFDKPDVVSLAAAKWYIYIWIQMRLFICLYVLLMNIYVHFLEIKYLSINQSMAPYEQQSGRYRCHSITETLDCLVDNTEMPKAQDGILM